MKKGALIIALICVFVSCSKKIENIEKDLKQIDYSSELRVFLKNNYSKIQQSDYFDSNQFDSIHWTQAFYKNNKYQPIWINDSIDLSDKGKSLIDTLVKAEHYGLTAASYQTTSLLKLKRELIKINDKSKRYQLASDLEILLTNAYLSFGKHLNYGYLDVIDSITVLPRKKFTINMPQYLLEAYRKDSLLEKLFEIQPTHSEYKKLQQSLVVYLKNTSLTTQNIQVQNFRRDSAKAIVQSKKALVLHKYLDSVHNDSLYLIALKRFQRTHGLTSDGLVGTHTAEALSLSTYEYYLKIVANLEMHRWKEPYQKNYILVNIPAYKLQLFDGDEEVFESKIVVGKQKTATPEIRDSLQYIIAYPYWNIPRKISVEELLIKAQRDSTYLTRNNYEVLTHAKEQVDPNTIDWNAMNNDTFNYRIRQKGGGYNSLGLVKFIFPNKYAVYLHDTPSKNLFNTEIRAYSHGCVRVEKALLLTDHLLNADSNKYTIDSIYKFIDDKKEKPIKLNKKIPVYLYYFTAAVDRDDQLILYQDIYGIDEKLTHLLTQKKMASKSLIQN